MAIPQKGRRSITVDSVDYYYVAPFERSERVVIQSASGHGPFLFVFPFAILKPSHVADAIRFAISRDWKPAKPGSNCWLVFDVDDDDNAYFEYLQNDDFRVVTYCSNGKRPAELDIKRFSDTRPWYDRPSPSGKRQYKTVSELAGAPTRDMHSPAAIGESSSNFSTTFIGAPSNAAPRMNCWFNFRRERLSATPFLLRDWLLPF